MPTTLSPILKAVPASVASSVKAVVDLARPPVRDALIAECRLSMRGRADRDEGAEQGQVPVQVKLARAHGVSPVILPDDYERVLCLARHAKALREAASGTKGLLHLHQELAELPGELPRTLGTVEPIRATHLWAAELLRHLEAHDPVKKILAFDEDTLGCYVCVDRLTDEHRANRARVEVYWGVIGLVSAWAGFTVEDTTVVVLAHELAHAFTQLGAEIEGRRWPSADFVDAEPALVEALAQYYTERCLRRLQGRYPGALRVFLDLMAKQPAIYRGHCAWAPHVDPEAVRQAMLEVRRARERTLAEFEERLAKAAAEFPPLSQRAENE